MMGRMRTYLGLGVIVVAATAACGEAEGGEPPRDGATAGETGTREADAGGVAVSVPADWVRVEVHCGYSFMAPPDVVAAAAQGTDSCIDEWVTSGCMHAGDYGSYSSDLSEYAGQPEYAETRATIDGRSARLLTVTTPDQGLVAAAHFPRVDTAGVVKLTVWAGCDDAAGQQNALLSFRTITFEP
jgi:hypothetical protein